MKLEKEHSAAHDRISSPQFLRACQTLRQSLYPILGSVCLWVGVSSGGNKQACAAQRKLCVSEQERGSLVHDPLFLTFLTLRIQAEIPERSKYATWFYEAGPLFPFYTARGGVNQAGGLVFEPRPSVYS